MMVLMKLVTLSTIITFLWSGLTINLLQLINYILLRKVNFSLFTKVNYYLMYSAWSQIVALFDWFFGATFKVYHGSVESEKEIFKDNNIFLANHTYELDWVGAWLVTDKYGQLANCKAMLKSDLKYIPVVGWSWAMSDQLFLDRNWEKDRHKLSGCIDTLLRYKPMVATFFCEGTRFTKDKVEECKQFAAERGMVSPKYHLIPRTKGFVAVIKHLKEKQRQQPDFKAFVYNAQVAYDENEALSIADILKRGTVPVGSLYFDRVSIDDIPNDDEGCANWLYDLYLKKDDLQEYYDKHHKFPGILDGRFVEYKPRWSSLFNWIFWTLYTFVPIFFLVGYLYWRFGPFLVSIVLASFFLVSYIYLNYIMYQADISDEERCETDKKSK